MIWLGEAHARYERQVSCFVPEPRNTPPVTNALRLIRAGQDQYFELRVPIPACRRCWDVCDVELVVAVVFFLEKSTI